jgi:hypothetical protein
MSSSASISAAQAASLDEIKRGSARGYALIALVSAGTILLSAEGPVQVIVGGAATSGVFLYGFLQFNPRIVALELIALTLLGYYLLPSAPTYWMMASALGGGVGAILALKNAEEDDHFFLPAMATGAFTLVLFVLGQEGGFADSVGIIEGYIADYGAASQTMLAEPANENLRRFLTELSIWGAIQPRIGLVALSALMGLWVLVLWIMNRLARRRAGKFDYLFSSLLLFRVRSGYIFLLIAALIFEILSTWSERESLRALAYPLFAICAAAFLMVHVGIVAFMMAARRLESQTAPSPVAAVLFLFALALSLYIGPIIGLLDVWFDFRKLKALRERLTQA